MKICEATKYAIEQDYCITLPEMEGTAKIKPTNGGGKCIFIGSNGSESKWGWQPSAKDLIRDDWMVVL